MLLTLTGVPNICQTPQTIGVAVVAPKHALTSRHHGQLIVEQHATTDAVLNTMFWSRIPPTSRRQPPLPARASLLPTRTLPTPRRCITALKSDADIKLTRAVVLRLRFESRKGFVQYIRYRIDMNWCSRDGFSLSAQSELI